MRKHGPDSLSDMLRHEPPASGEQAPQGTSAVAPGDVKQQLQVQQRLQQQFMAAALLLLWYRSGRQ